MDKDLILITSYCPSKDKKETLLDLLRDLQQYRGSYSILLSSHTPLDPLFMEYVDHYFFEKKNEVLTDIGYRQNSWFAPKENYVIWSSYTEIGNTLGPIWDMLIPSIAVAKSFGYKKTHYLEYDAKITDVSELEENSNLLNTLDYVIYGTETSHKLYGSFLSFNVDRIIDEWKLPGESILPQLFFGKYPKVPENVIHDLIVSQRTHIKKSHENLSDKGIHLGLKRGGKVIWEVPYYEPSSNRLMFISYNINSEKYSTKIIINDNQMFSIGPLMNNHWQILELSKKIQDVKNIKVFRNDIKFLDLNFEEPGYLEKFINYNSVLDDNSLLLKSQ
jgi:hypothetical protein